jgi:hypothetical protein
MIYVSTDKVPRSSLPNSSVISVATVYEPQVTVLLKVYLVLTANFNAVLTEKLISSSFLIRKTSPFQHAISKPFSPFHLGLIAILSPEEDHGPEDSSRAMFPLCDGGGR